MDEARATIHGHICTEMHSTYLAKNSDYGSAFEKLFEEVGAIAAYTKVADKFYRVQQLWNKPEAAKVQESLRDSLMDLACYCVMWVTEMDTADSAYDPAYDGESPRKVGYTDCPRCGYGKATAPTNDHAGHCDDCGHTWDDWDAAAGYSGPKCPKCNSNNTQRLGGIDDQRVIPYKCASCGERFGDKV